MTLAKGENTCSPQGRWWASAPSIPLLHSLWWNAVGEGDRGACTGMDRIPLHSPHPILTSQSLRPLSRAGETGQVTGGFTPCLSNTLRMSTCVTSFLSWRSGDSPDAQGYRSCSRTMLGTQGDRRAFAEETSASVSERWDEWNLMVSGEMFWKWLPSGLAEQNLLTQSAVSCGQLNPVVTRSSYSCTIGPRSHSPMADLGWAPPDLTPSGTQVGSMLVLPSVIRKGPLFPWPIPKNQSRVNCGSTSDVFALVTSTDVKLIIANHRAKSLSKGCEALSTRPQREGKRVNICWTIIPAVPWATALHLLINMYTHTHKR